MSPERFPCHLMKIWIVVWRFLFNVIPIATVHSSPAISPSEDFPYKWISCCMYVLTSVKSFFVFCFVHWLLLSLLYLEITSWILDFIHFKPPVPPPAYAPPTPFTLYVD